MTEERCFLDVNGRLNIGFINELASQSRVRFSQKANQYY